YKIAALSIAAIACIAISNGGTTSQDLKTGYIVGATPSRQQIAILVGALSSALVLGFVILKLNDAGTVFARRDYPQVGFAASEFDGREHLRGPDADRDAAEYIVVRLRDPRGPVPPGKYLVDDQGRIKYLEDPGINGQLTQRDNGERVTSKFSAPKPVLMSFIIEGIMTQKLPWGLVLIGVFISVVLELCGMSSLAFAVGVYLPLSTSTPIMLGGIVRYLADKTAKRKLSEAEARRTRRTSRSASASAGPCSSKSRVCGLRWSWTRAMGPMRSTLSRRWTEFPAARADSSSSSRGWRRSSGWRWWTTRAAKALA